MRRVSNFGTRTLLSSFGFAVLFFLLLAGICASVRRRFVA